MSCPFRGQATKLPTESVETLQVSTSSATLNGSKSVDLSGSKSESQQISPMTYQKQQQNQANVAYENSVLETLRQQTTFIETNINAAEKEVEIKEEEAFCLRRNDYEIQKLRDQQQAEARKKRQAFQSLVMQRNARKNAKKMLLSLNRETKNRDNKIREQEYISSAADDVRRVVADRRHEFDELLTHLEKQHEKALKKLSEAQERRIKYEKVLLNLETRHMKEEARSSLNKRHQVRLGHQKAVDKKTFENLREVQQMEIKHYKEKFEYEMEAYERLQTTKAAHFGAICELDVKQRAEAAKHKDQLVDTKEKLKLARLEQDHKAEMRKLISQHRQRLRLLQQLHKERLRSGNTTGITLLEDAIAHQSKKSFSRCDSSGSAQSNLNGEDETTGSIHSGELASPNGLAGQLFQAVQENKARDTNNNRDEDNIVFHLEVQVSKMEEMLRQLTSHHKITRESLLSQQSEEFDLLEANVVEKMREMEKTQEYEIKNVKLQQESEMNETLKVQQREIEMEQSVANAEGKMLMERRILNTVLDNVVDGIISIDTIGTLVRFNHAAETMFGYSVSEVLGKNIKMLMPESFAVNHDQYLRNYLTTGVKKVIGTGRRVFGLKKDGTEFPVHLSISEVRDEGFHLFTGIVRDLTQEVQEEEEKVRAEEAKKKELNSLIKELDETKQKTSGLIQSMLPEKIANQLLAGHETKPQDYAGSTIFFSDICGFTDLSSQSTAPQIITLLNTLYTMFDDIINKHDVYKVETVGDAYMVVSGVPNPNGNRHAGEIATMALHILSKVHRFVIPHMPDTKLRIRIGIHTGPVTAGVVGRASPRYCLFGDTVNVSSRMESTGVPMHIQISEATFKSLSELGGYRMTTRGEVSVKGKGSMKTYFLVGKDGLDLELPEF